MQNYQALCIVGKSKIQSVLEEVLKAHFIHVKIVQNTDDGLKEFENSRYDFVIIDADSPFAKEIELIEKIKSASLLIPVIIISEPDANFLAQIMELGIEGYVRKPIESENLKNQIIKVVKKHKIISQSYHNSALLKEYKDAIDRSAIVSKTDPNGIITYINEEFVKISQYQPHELLGKPHNVIRHPDMPSSVFKSMWETIKDKKPWQGIVKNRKKDGSTYCVQAYISPILNEKGEIEEYIAIRHDITELENYRENLEQKLRESTDEIIKTQKEVIYTMGTISEKRSKETGLHVKRVASYSYMLARLYGLDEKEARLIEQASPMHDIGKIAIPDSVLQKPGPLDEKEWEIIKTHSSIGYEMLKHSKRELFQAAAIIAHEHHEHWDGNGYPRNLKGDEIHIYGRITAIADVFDALGHDRVYKKAWPIEKIIDFFKKQRAKQFDPDLTDIFLKHIHQFELTRQNLSDNDSGLLLAQNF